eukprot:jgi/Tetstr1/456960/TSEL_043629.t1
MERIVSGVQRADSGDQAGALEGLGTAPLPRALPPLHAGLAGSSAPHQRQMQPLSRRRPTPDFALLLSPSVAKATTSAWPKPEDTARQSAGTSGRPSRDGVDLFHGPLAHLYSDGLIAWPDTRFTAEEWERVMSTNPAWPDMAAENQTVATAYQALLICADRVRAALDGVGLLVKRKVVERWMLVNVTHAIEMLQYLLGVTREEQLRVLEHIDPLVRLRFPVNLEPMHFLTQRKLQSVLTTLAELTCTQPSAAAHTYSTCEIMETVVNFRAFCTLLLRLAQVSLEDVTFHYRSTHSQADYQRHLREGGIPSMNERLADAQLCCLLVGATPACQREQRFQLRERLGFVASKLFTLSMIRRFRKDFLQPLKAVTDLVAEDDAPAEAPPLQAAASIPTKAPQAPITVAVVSASGSCRC